MTMSSVVGVKISRPANRLRAFWIPKLVRATVAIIGLAPGCAGLVLISGCASPQPAPAAPVSVSPPPDVHVPAVTRADVVVLLTKANDVQVYVPQSEFEQIVQNSIGHMAYDSTSEIPGVIKSQVDECNNIDDSDPNPDQEITCDNLGKDLAPLMLPGSDFKSNVDLPAAEIAFARACVAPQNNAKPAFGCLDLGSLYEYEGKPELALAVYQNAEKCQGTLAAEAAVREIDPDQQVDWTNRERKECLKKEVAILYDMHRYDDERKVATILCNAASEIGCGYLKSLGADVNMQAVEQRQAGLQAADRATAAADYAADAKASAEANAKFSAEMQALHSLPGGSDPNAIVDTANHQAASMNALGAANDAALQRAAEQRREQAAAQQVQGNSQQPEQSSLSSPSGTGSEYCPNVVGYTDSGIPHSKAYPDFGATCNPVRDETSCIRVVSNVWKAADPELNLVLSNACSTPVRLTVWGPSDDPEGETQNVGPGREFTYWSQRQTWHYEADDGVDCPVDYARPGCSNIVH